MTRVTKTTGSYIFRRVKVGVMALVPFESILTTVAFLLSKDILIPMKRVFSNNSTFCST